MNRPAAHLPVQDLVCIVILTESKSNSERLDQSWSESNIGLGSREHRALSLSLSKIEHTNVTKINIGGEKSVGQWRRRRVWQSGLTKRFVNC
jgi:alpha-tubulin suppressor-like RCC1 family protein